MDDTDKLENTALLLTAVAVGMYIRLTTGGGCGGWILCLTLCGLWGVFGMVIRYHKNINLIIFNVNTI